MSDWNGAITLDKRGVLDNLEQSTVSPIVLLARLTRRMIVIPSIDPVVGKFTYIPT